MAISFDPRKLVGPPFKACPSCGAERFGVYNISSDSYSRRCVECWEKGEFALWPLARKVIYVDQFAISNMMKALNKAHQAHSRAAADPFWLTLFERLDRLVKLQLAICPYSDAHRHESMMTGFFEPLKRMYEQLSHGVSFDSLEAIARRQLNVALLAWLRGEAAHYDFDAERVTNGGLNEWKERFIISVSGVEYPPEVVDGIRKFRDSVHAGVRDVFEHYREVRNTDFEYWSDRERTAGGRAILQAAQLYAQRMRDIAAGIVPFSFDNVYSSNGLDHFNLILEVLKAHGTSSDELGAKIRAFLESDAFKDYPASRIGALLWAAIARNAALGQKKVPNTGMMNDINVVSTLLPYCDAMFIDNGCRGLWESIPKQHRSFADKPVFSYNTRDCFLTYLQEIEDGADPAVLACVREVYGEPRPFLTMYEEEERRKRRRQ